MQSESRNIKKKRSARLKFAMGAGKQGEPTLSPSRSYLTRMVSGRGVLLRPGTFFEPSSFLVTSRSQKPSFAARTRQSRGLQGSDRWSPPGTPKSHIFHHWDTGGDNMNTYPHLSTTSTGPLLDFALQGCWAQANGRQHLTRRDEKIWDQYTI